MALPPNLFPILPLQGFPCAFFLRSHNPPHPCLFLLMFFLLAFAHFFFGHQDAHTTRHPCRSCHPHHLHELVRVGRWLLGQDGGLLVTNTKAVVSLTAYGGGSAGLVGITRAAVYPMSNYVL